MGSLRKNNQMSTHSPPEDGRGARPRGAWSSAGLQGRPGPVQAAAGEVPGVCDGWKGRFP